MPCSPKAFFLPFASEGRLQGNARFCVYHPASLNGSACKPRALVIYIHPFAEEMNKSRRMAALQSRALAKAGYAVLQMDLLGCGDSSGDFGDATWSAWVHDVVCACQWLRDQNPMPADEPLTKLWLWGLRAGCLLAVDAAQHIDTPCNFLFWQAPASGKVLLQQFMRLQWAADIGRGETAAKSEAMRQGWARGGSVEIAGYPISAALAQGLELATPHPPAPRSAAQKLVWLELNTRAEATLSPASAKTIGLWEAAGYMVHSNTVAGPAFWHTAEIEDAPALIAATVKVITAHDLS